MPRRRVTVSRRPRTSAPLAPAGAPGPAALPDALRPLRGRGAVTNRTGRFEARDRIGVDDGWGTVEAEAPRLATTVTPERTRDPFARNDSPDVPFDRSINPYKGCEHGCVYCFARPTHAYLGLSAGLDFETRIFSKPQAPARLRQALARKGYRPQVVALGANTDPYQPAERDLRITRALLEVLAAHRHPVAIVTKSQLVLRDLDLLVPMAQQRLAAVMISVTTLDRELARRMEPRATSPAGRIETMRRLAAAGVPVGVLASPVVPGLTDAELEGILESAAQAGCRTAGYILLRLPGEVQGLFSEWLRAHYPRKADKVLGLLREMRDGRLYRPGFGTRMTGTGPSAQLLAQRFDLARRRLGLDEHEAFALDVTRFRVPPRPGENLELFGDPQS
jgi:DNA repair photolyase